MKRKSVGHIGKNHIHYAKPATASEIVSTYPIPQKTLAKIKKIVEDILEKKKKKTR